MPGASTDFAVTSNRPPYRPVGIHVVDREGHLDQAHFARGHADELVLEAGDEGAGADIDADIAAGAALERRAVERAGEVDDDAVALLDLGALALRRERPVLVGDLAERLFDFGVGDVGDHPLEGDALEIRQFDLGQDLKRHRIGEIGLPADDLLDLGLRLGQRDLGLHGEPRPRSSTILELISRITASMVSAMTERP